MDFFSDLAIFFCNRIGPKITALSISFLKGRWRFDQDRLSLRRSACSRDCRQFRRRPQRPPTQGQRKVGPSPGNGRYRTFGLLQNCYLTQSRQNEVKRTICHFLSRKSISSKFYKVKNKFQNWEIIFMERMKQKTFSDQSSYSTLM